MGQYEVNSTNSLNFILSSEKSKIGELVYKKWYSFNAEIISADGTKCQLEPKGFWDSKIELKCDNNTLLEFKMGWTGIIIKTSFGNKEETYLFKLKGLLSNKFILLNTDKEELMVAETSFKWSKLKFDYNIETSETFERIENKELLLLTILHCINYYITMIVAASA